jgi:hypothetical protein
MKAFIRAVLARLPSAKGVFKQGDVKLEDFVGKRRSRRWGRSRYTKSLREIEEQSKS